MKYLILGKNGQLGRSFVKRITNNMRRKDTLVALGKEECDISNLGEVIQVFESVKPDIVINCAAYNYVDAAETQYSEAVKVNSVGVRNLAFACKRFGSFMVHYSTDYVFDGEKEGGLYTEEDEPNPINEYGKSKLMGEAFLRDEIDKFLIFRVSWVYGEGKQNFIYKLLTWVKSSDYLRIAYDEFSVPTSTDTIVELSLLALEKELTGLYHLTNSGYASRYEWAKSILENLGINKFIQPVSKEFFNLAAKRPKFSAMSNDKLRGLLSIDIPMWSEELKRVLTKSNTFAF